MNERINPDSDSIDIYRIYLDVCVYSSQIRTKITTYGPGNIDTMFREFKLKFDLLFTLTKDHKDINEYNRELVSKINKWLSIEMPVKKKKYIFDGISLFNAYKSRLISYKIIDLR